MRPVVFFNRNGQFGGSAYKGEMRAEYYFRIEAEGEHPEGSMVVGIFAYVLSGG